MTSNTTTPAKTGGEGSIITALQDPRMAEQFAAVLPKVLTPDRFVRFALTAVRKVPKLQQCTKESVMASFMTCAELGLEPDGRRAHLIPYGSECTLIIDYKGLVELIMRSGKVKAIRAETVCERDHFEWHNGAIDHRIDWRKDRGEAQAYYAEAELDDGTRQNAVMTREDVEKIRSKSKAGRSGPWVDHFDEMAKKTAIRRLSKLLPLSAEVRDAMEMDGDQLGPSMPDISRPLFTRPDADMPMGDAEDQESTEPEGVTDAD